MGKLISTNQKVLQDLADGGELHAELNDFSTSRKVVAVFSKEAGIAVYRRQDGGDLAWAYGLMSGSVERLLTAGFIVRRGSEPVYRISAAGRTELSRLSAGRAYTVEDQLRRHEADLNSGCWLWPGSTNEHGYGILTFGSKRYKAHRFYYAHIVGPIPDGKFLCHKCDTPACVNPSHMNVGTQTDNMRDCRMKERSSMGERHGGSKLTAKQVVEIRLSPEPHHILAARFGVSRPTITTVKRGRSWAHVATAEEAAL